MSSRFRLLGSFFFIALLLMSCNVDEIVWTESQVFCVFRTPLVEEKFESPSIAFRLSLSNNIDVSQLNFEFRDSLEILANFKLKKLKKIKKERKTSFGLSLESREVQKYFSRDTTNYNSCYEDQLVSMIENGRLFALYKDRDIEILKSSDYVLSVGFKDK